jgi:hypothetical protein
MKRFLVMTLPPFVASCERTAVREYEAPKEMFPQKSLVSEQLEQAQTVLAILEPSSPRGLPGVKCGGH